MANFKNSEVIKRVLQTFVRKIGRRIHESFAVATIDIIIKQLESKYDFFRYVKIENTLYPEGINAIDVMPLRLFR